MEYAQSYNDFTSSDFSSENYQGATSCNSNLHDASKSNEGPTSDNFHNFKDAQASNFELSSLNANSKPFIPQYENYYHHPYSDNQSSELRKMSNLDHSSIPASQNGTHVKSGTKNKGNKSYNNSFPSFGQKNFRGRNARNYKPSRYNHQNDYAYEERESSMHNEGSSNYYSDFGLSHSNTESRNQATNQRFFNKYSDNSRRSTYNSYSQYNSNGFYQNKSLRNRSDDRSQSSSVVRNAKSNYKQSRGKYGNKNGLNERLHIENNIEEKLNKNLSKEIEVSPNYTNENDYDNPSIVKSNESAHEILPNEDEKTQREYMTKALSKGLYECMVCCEKIKQQNAIWSCINCFNCFHLNCIQKWATTSKEESGWRCPACQNLNAKMPSGYFCFCKKMREPEWNRRDIPHSCGEMCGKKRVFEWCIHKCTILCHPGPCPECSAYVNRKCQCEKNSKSFRCSNAEPFLCGEKCQKLLNCLFHSCEEECHVGECDPCAVVLEKVCFCGKETKSVICTEESSCSESYSCEKVCTKALSCGMHECSQICHDGQCDSCPRAVENVTTCPCGKMNLKQYYGENSSVDGIEERKTCLDPIPLCGEVCGKILDCGSPGAYHTCQTACHDGPCPPCVGQTSILCRCGYVNKKIPCVELKSKADEVTCDKQCKKMRQCGRHKCGQKCCIDLDHICTKICNLNLNCRRHKCQEICHRGNCPRCLETSFDELTCHCGASVTYPPVPCGAKPPACSLPCRRPKSCSHPVSHMCHADEKCPPCTTFVSKQCYGGHTMIQITPCYVSALSCGSQCAKRIKCGIHVCQRVCHAGPCVKKKCDQKCLRKRPTCGHSCGIPCHAGSCPNEPCKEKVTVTCRCGNRKVEISCAENEKQYTCEESFRLASDLHGLKFCGSVDISEMFSQSNKEQKLKRLECDDDCALLARNRQLALALQITNPDARESLGEASIFCDSIKEDAKKNLDFAQMVHSTLVDLVMKAKESKHRSRSHSFPPMNRDKRRFIRDYAKYFGCDSEAYDNEPNRNVVVIADKATCRLPPLSVVAQVKKEQGKRKVPVPVNSKLVVNDASSQMRKLDRNSRLDEKQENLWRNPKPVNYFNLP